MHGAIMIQNGYKIQYLRYDIVSKYSSKNSQATANDDIIADILHDLRGFPGNQC